MKPFIDRRTFIKYFLGSAYLLSNTECLAKVLEKQGKSKTLVILYTNDQHSRIEPFPDNDPKYPGMGGFAKRAKIIKEIRQAYNNNVLLLDAGDIFQGTPYFNYYHGKLEFQLMSQMGYDASTLGNHDFDLGIENIVQQLPYASFDFINCNYDVSNTALNKKILPYKIITKNGLKIGITGVGIELEGLVLKENYGDIVYHSPIEKMQAIERFLKLEKKCDYIICLSHLGYQYKDNKISDLILAENLYYTDLIIGGHTHTFLNQPISVKNKNNAETLVTQVGWAGIWLGQLVVNFSECNKKIFQTNENHRV
ncbi:MAG: metallophosphatase [Bacteroidia bacterium]|jgi:5'-nucleotidase|nr:metallophosphatase [Bacteroidia bacterium]